jgi:uncharacterized protein YceK
MKIALLFLCLTGCGTFTSHMRWVDTTVSDHGIYRGVKTDAETIGDVCKSESGAWPVVIVPLCVLDMPLSAVADTFMLPVDLSKP